MEGNLVNLECLCFCGNAHITELPEEIGKLYKLLELDISKTSIKQFPSKITNLINLRVLDLCNVPININMIKIIIKFKKFEYLILSGRHKSNIKK